MWRRHWRITTVIAVQLLILAAVPGRKVLARIHGTDVTLETRPVDPYDVMSGYYVTLGYKAEDAPLAPGFHPDDGATVYITVARGTPAWRGVAVTADPIPPEADQVSLKATWDGRRARLLDAQRLYVPEAERFKVTEAFRAAASPAVADLKVDSGGAVALLRLHVNGHTWGDR